MRLYSGTSSQFVEDAFRNQIAGKLKSAFFDYFRYYPSPSEVHSWQNSLRAISQVFSHADLTDHGILLEYQLPLSSKRLDCMITGHDAQSRDSAVIIELKQWEKSEVADAEREVLSWVGGAKREVLHPSVQVNQYQEYLQDTHTAFYEGNNPVRLSSCSYLHNYTPFPGDPIFAAKFDTVLRQSPAFTADDVDELSQFLQQRLINGNGQEVLSRIEESKYRPSKKLMEHVGNVIAGLPEYVLLDEQLVVYDKIVAVAKKGFHDRRKTVLIIKGGPGTGKSVIALRVMGELLLQGYNVHYATGSRAFTTTLRKIIGTRGSAQLKYFNSYTAAVHDVVDVLIADEAHRIRKTSQSRFIRKEDRTDTPQISELLTASKMSVFFIDDKQIVRPDEIGSVQYIREYAEKHNYRVLEYKLEAQFRCNGSEAFVNWINNTLDIERTANVLWNGTEGFDFQIFDSPLSLENSIKEKAQQGYSARMTAGFCWPWTKGLNPDGTLVEDVQIGDYKRPWNARPEAAHLPPNIPRSNLWAYDSNGINQVGCIYTAQGFEFDYVGIIFGNDLVYDLDQAAWEADKNHSYDNVVKRSKDAFLDLVKNTYRVLLSRGLKGCYVYFTDKDTERFFRSRMETR
jgi:DUF2075 family protein